MLNPWEVLRCDSVEDSINARRVFAEHPIDIFWAKDAAGSFCFLVDNILCDKNTALPQLFGIELIIAKGSNPDTMRLVMKLRNNEWWQVFYMLCCDIVEASYNVTPESFVSVLLNRLGKWQSMLRLLTERRLSQQEVQGLWGELMYMHKYLAPKFGWKLAINAWKGPMGHPQDFGLDDEVIEVKTLHNTGRMSVKISSLDQLDPVGAKMFLHVIIVGIADELNAKAMSLNDLVDTIKEHIGDDTCVKDAFDSALTNAGYVYDVAYDWCRYFIVNEYTYGVRDDFPRICKSQLPLGVESGEYTIFLGNSESFLTKPDWIEA